MINIILSIAGAKYVCFSIELFYLSTPLGRPEYVKIKLLKIPQEFITEYNLNSSVHKGWVYFEIRCGYYGLPQNGILEKNSSDWDWKNKDTMKPELPRVYGDTNGDLSNSIWL